MTGLQNSRYWLIGASEGLGRALAKELDRAGAQLVLSARNAGRLDELSQALGNALSLPLDVTDSTAVGPAVEAAGRIDGLIYNAGAYLPMTARNWDSEAALAMADVNFMGALRVLGSAVPAMVERGAGDIVLIGSLAGYRGLPAAIGYGASKAALMSLAETMRHDLNGSGVTVHLVNPGFVKTRLTDRNSFRMPQLMSPEAAALRIVKAMGSKRFRTDFPAPFSWGIRLYRMLPDFLAYRRR